MRQVTKWEEQKKQEFLAEAARLFAENPHLKTYTEGDIVPGCYFAVRWGLDNDCILLLKLDEYEEPTIYAQWIEQWKGVPPV